MNKILTMAWKDVYTTFTNRTLLLIMIVTPVGLATIMGLAFGSSGGEITLPQIQLAVVNLDTSSSDRIDYSDTVTRILLSDSAESGADETTTCTFTQSDSVQAGTLSDFLSTTRYDTVESARQAVDDGTVSAMVVIPDGFNATLSSQPRITILPPLFIQRSINLVIELMPATTGGTPLDFTPLDTNTPQSATVQIYANGERRISAMVVRTITESIINQMVTGSTAVRVSLEAILSTQDGVSALANAPEDAFDQFACAFNSQSNPIQIVRAPLDDVQNLSGFEQVLIMMGSSQAVFFSIFTANGAILSIFNDKKRGVLMRLLATPTPRIAILIGKLLGAALQVLLQVSLLLVALTAVASMVLGKPVFIWGTQIHWILLLLLSITLAVSGVAVFVVGISRSEEQARSLGSVVSIAMAALGGAFGFNVGAIQQVSFVYWSSDAFYKLAGGNTDIGLNVMVLAVSGAILFTIGSWLFNRRIEL